MDWERGTEREAGQEQSISEQAREMTVMEVARVWADVLGVEVSVRTLGGRGLRVEVAFDSPEGALASAGKLGEALARGTKRG